MHNLNDNVNYTIISKYSRIHAKMSSEELVNRLLDMLSKELDEKYKKITIIYSGHGWKSGLSPYSGIVEYRDFIKMVVNGLKISKGSRVNEIRFILDCCYASNFTFYLGSFL